MAKWNNNNLAHITTWITLKVLDQLNQVFSKSEKIKMKELTFWNSTTSKKFRDIQIKALVSQIDNIFKEVHGATYEDKVTRKNALKALSSIMADGEKTVKDFATTCDAQYLYWKEGKTS